MLAASSLIRKGYIPRELPHPFNGVALANAFDAAPATLTMPGGKWTEGARHNLARPGGFRRPLKVPNPRHYIPLARVLETEWTTIDAHLKSQTISSSRPVVTRTAERAVKPRFRLGESEKLRVRHWRGQKFILRTDVGQFYPSLYTHAIPWALHGKPHAKANFGKTKGDQIDKAIRDGSSGQTIGIPIGPDTSFIVAEIVMTAVDAIARSKMPKLRAYRYLDDYDGAFRTRSEAEEALGHLEGALGEFELVVNPFKTHILELPQPFRANWPRQIATFEVRPSRVQQQTDLVGLFSLAAELADAHAGPLKYALSRSRNINLDPANWRLFQSLVWSAVSAEPTTMPTALDLLQEKSQQVAKPILKTGAGEVAEALITTHAPLRNGSEVAWALWAAIRLDVSLSTSAAGAVAAMEDDFVALLALDAESRGLLGLNKTMWESLINYGEVLRGPHWLLAYEATMKGWLGSATATVAADGFFKEIQRRGVEFYDPAVTWKPFTGPAGPLPGGDLPDSYL